MACSTAWWLCVTILSLTVLAQQSQDSFQRCNDLTTTRQCFKTERNPDNSLQNFEGATHWCAEQGYSLVTIDSAEVHAAVEQFLAEFELTFSNVWIAAMRHNQWTWVNEDVFSDGTPILPCYDVASVFAQKEDMFSKCFHQNITQRFGIDVSLWQ